MRKFSKICLVTAFILILIGGTMCVIGSVTGGWLLAQDMGQKNAWVRFVWNHGWGYWNRDFDDWDDWMEQEALDELDDIGDVVYQTVENAGMHTGHGSAGEISHESSHEQTQAQMPANYSGTDIAAGDVRNLQIDIGGAALYIGESEDDNFGIEIDGKGNYKYYERNRTFYLEGNINRRDLLDININTEKVYLYIPKGMTFQEVDITVGAGLISLDTLYADEVDLIVGAGQIDAGELVCRELSVETGAGEMLLNDVTVDELDVVNSAGHTYVYGSVSREVDVECNLGQAELVLAGKEQDFNYEIDCSMGSVTVGSKSYSALANDTHINNRAAKECDLQCSMGEVTVFFYE